MPRISRTFETAAPPAAVIRYLAALSHAEQWDHATVRCVRVGVGPIEVGATWYRESKIGGFRTGNTYTLEELSPSRVAFRGRSKAIKSTETIDVSACGAGSRISYERNLNFDGAAALAAPVVELILRSTGRETEVRMVSILNSLRE